MPEKFTPPSDAHVEEGFTPPKDAVVEEQPLKKKASTETETGTSSGSEPSSSESSSGSLSQSSSGVQSTGNRPYNEEQLKSKRAVDVKIMNATIRQFNENPLFYPNNPNAEKNKESYIKKLDTLGYDTGILTALSNDMRETQEDLRDEKIKKYLTTPIGGLSQYDLENANDLGFWKYLHPQGLVYHGGKDMLSGIGHGLEKFNEGIKMGLNALGDDTNTVGEVAGGVGKGAIKSAAGLVGAGFSAIPQVEAFNIAVAPIHEAAEKNPDNEYLKKLQFVVDAPFTVGSKLVNAAGYSSEKGTSADVAELINVIVPIAAHSMYNKSKGALRAQGDLKEISKRAEENSLTEVDKQNIDELYDNAKNTSIGEIKNSLAEAEKVNNQHPELNKVAKEIDDLKSANKNGVFDNDIAEKEQKKTELEDNIANTHAEEATKSGVKSQIESDLDGLKKQQSETPEENRTAHELLQSKIDEHEKAIAEINNSEVAAEPTQASEVNQPAAIEAENVEPIKTETNESIQEPSANEVLSREQGKVGETGGEREGVGQSIEGTQAPETSQKEVRADEKAQAEGFKTDDPEEFDRYIAENSESAKELAETYQRRMSDKIDAADTLINKIKDLGFKISRKSWAEFGEPRDFEENKSIRDKYIDDNAEPLDTAWEKLNATPEQIIEAIRWDELKKLEPKLSSVDEKIQAKYKELTGKKLTPKTARESINEMTDTHAKEMAAAEKDYDKAIASGRLSVIDGEVVSQPELKTYKRDVMKQLKGLKEKFSEFEKMFEERVRPKDGERMRSKAERKAYLEEQTPRARYIMENMDSILKKLVDEKVITTNCL